MLMQTKKKENNIPGSALTRSEKKQELQEKIWSWILLRTTKLTQKRYSPNMKSRKMLRPGNGKYAKPKMTPNLTLLTTRDRK